MISSNEIPRTRHNELYSERLKAIPFFQKRGEVDLYGVGWDGPPYRMGATWVSSAGRRVGHRLRTAVDRLVGPRDPLLAAGRLVCAH